MLFSVQCNDKMNITCNVNGETCVNGKCRCGGMASSCEGRISGSYCDVTSSICKCTNGLDTCKKEEGGDVCDVDSNSCKCGTGPTCIDMTAPYCNSSSKEEDSKCTCSSTVDACTGENVDRCFEGSCRCGDTKTVCGGNAPKCIKGSCGMYVI